MPEASPDVVFVLPTASTWGESGMPVNHNLRVTHHILGAHLHYSPTVVEHLQNIVIFR
jgi:hypothetical protein